MNVIISFSISDLLAVFYFMICWLLFSRLTKFGLGNRPSLTDLMNRERANWMKQLPKRDLRIVDVSIIAGLQNGTAFFASSMLLAIGGCFAMFSATDEIGKIHARLAEGYLSFNAVVWELKLLGLAILFAYSFFKFAWSYRLFNYCSILIGSVPQVREADSPETTEQIRKATRLNVIAASHFNSGQRGIFFAIGYVGWFIGPLWLIFTTTLVSVVLIRRQFFSAARRTLLVSGKE